jgi:thiol-disulfide isomerase/thioredoxin
MRTFKNLAIATALSCFPTTIYATKTILCGHINYDTERIITLSYYANPIDDIENKKTQVYSKIDKNNNFRLILDINTPIQINVLAGESWLFYNKFLLPGDSLYMEFDSTYTKIEGREENGISGMFDYENGFTTREKIKEMQSAGSTMQDTAFARHWNNWTDSSIAYYQKYYQHNPTTKAYFDVVKTELDYEAAVNMLQFGFRGKKGNDEIFTKPDFMKYLNRFPFNNEEALHNSKYIHFLDQFTICMLIPMGGRSTLWSKPEYANDFNRHRLQDSIARKYFKGKVYDIVLYNILYDEVTALESKRTDSSFATEYIETRKNMSKLGSGFNDKNMLPRLLNKLKATKDLKPAYDFEAKTADGKTVKLSDFKGKVVYIDIWATNCAPCVAELPHIKKLHKKYEGEDVVFLNISFDADFKKWNDFVAKNEFGGVHLIEPKATNSIIAQKYNIAGIPRYMLVNRNGIMLTSNAPRASQKPDEMIDKALRSN